MDGTLTFADAQNWFVVTEPADGVFAMRESLHEVDVRSYLVTGDERAILVDTGMGAGNIRAIVENITDLPVTVVNSHSHWDHIGGNWQFDEIAIHAAEAAWLSDSGLAHVLQDACVSERLNGPLPPGVVWEKLTIPHSKATRLLNGGEQFDLGGKTLETIHTPGHSPGLLVLLDRAAGVLLSTDTVYPGLLYAQFDGCDLDAYLESLETLAQLAPVLNLVLPSHSGDTMPVAMIPAMRDSMAAVLAGRQPDEIDDEQAIHRFVGFGIIAPPDYRGSTAL